MQAPILLSVSPEASSLSYILLLASMCSTFCFSAKSCASSVLCAKRFDGEVQATVPARVSAKLSSAIVPISFFILSSVFAALLSCETVVRETAMTRPHTGQGQVVEGPHLFELV